MTCIFERVKVLRLYCLNNDINQYERRICQNYKKHIIYVSCVAQRNKKTASNLIEAVLISSSIWNYSPCSQTFLANNCSSVSSLFSSRIQQSTGQTDAHCGSS